MSVQFKNGQHGTPSIVKNSLIAYYDTANTLSYVSGSSSIFDLSGNAHTGTLNKSGTSPLPVYNSSYGGNLYFTGSMAQFGQNGGYISLGTFTGLGSTDRTLDNWFFFNGPVPVGAGDQTRMVTFTNDDTTTFDYTTIGFGMTNTGGIEAGIGGPPHDAYIVVPFQYGIWNHACMTVASNVVNFYMNGKLVGTKTNTGAIATNPIGYIGRYNQGYGEYFVGNIATVSVYNRALSPTEVAQNFNAQKARFNIT